MECSLVNCKSSVLVSKLYLEVDHLSKLFMADQIETTQQDVPLKGRKRGRDTVVEDESQVPTDIPEPKIDEIHSETEEEEAPPSPPKKRRAEWKAKPPSDDPDSDHAANDHVKPTKMDNWMSEDEFLQFVEQNAPKGPPTKGYWVVCEPAKDKSGLLRVRARHTEYKSGRYNCNTPPFRCRFIHNEDLLLINKRSLQNMLAHCGPAMGLNVQYPDVFGPDVSTSSADSFVTPDKPVAKKIKKRPQKDEIEA